MELVYVLAPMLLGLAFYGALAMLFAMVAARLITRVVLDEIRKDRQRGAR